MANTFHWAVVVGIDSYPKVKPTLVCAQRDANAFQQWLTDPQGGDLPPANVTTITKTLPQDCSVKDAEPTVDQIFDAIKQRFDAAEAAVAANPLSWNDSRLYLYFSGHGVARDEGDSSLLAANATSEELGLHVSCSVLQEFFRKERYFHDLVIFADCCRDTLRGRAYPRFPSWTMGKTLGGGSTRVFFGCAAEYGQKAYEEQAGPEAERRGYFTRCLLEVLNNQADAPASTITGDALKKRLKSLLANLSALPDAPKAGLRFEPVCINEDDLKFGVTNKTPQYLVVLNLPADTTAVRLRRNSDSTLWSPQNPITPPSFKFRLPLGGYDVELSTNGGDSFNRYPEPIIVYPGYNERSLP